MSNKQVNCPLTIEATNMKFALLLIFILPYNLVYGQYSSNNDWDKFLNKFEEEFDALNLRGLNIYYVENLGNIQDSDSVKIQSLQFKKLQNTLNEFERTALSPEQKIEYDLMNYVLDLNLFRIDLEELWHLEKPDTISKDGIYHVPNGKEWYRYVLKYWVELSVEPEEMFEFGKEEVKRVKKAMQEIRTKSGMDEVAFEEHLLDEKFFCNSIKEIQGEYEKMKIRVYEKLPDYFPFTEEIPDVNIKASTRTGFVKTPAFYRRADSTFYYNYSNEPYCNRQFGWIYLHEAFPGHHYQILLPKKRRQTYLDDMFTFYGYTEGWAAYIEELGVELGAYKDIYEEYGKWEWDIIRSVRVVLDVGMNYYGWTDEEALLFWQKYISNKDDIAEREIHRMRNWPGQVITYKYGAKKIMDWKNKLSKTEGFNLKEFHRLVLENGDLPFQILDKHLNIQ